LPFFFVSFCCSRSFTLVSFWRRGATTCLQKEKLVTTVTASCLFYAFSVVLPHTYCSLLFSFNVSLLCSLFGRWAGWGYITGASSGSRVVWLGSFGFFFCRNHTDHGACGVLFFPLLFGRGRVGKEMRPVGGRIVCLYLADPCLYRLSYCLLSCAISAVLYIPPYIPTLMFFQFCYPKGSVLYHLPPLLSCPPYRLFIFAFTMDGKSVMVVDCIALS